MVQRKKHEILTSVSNKRTEVLNYKTTKIYTKSYYKQTVSPFHGVQINSGYPLVTNDNVVTRYNT